MFEKCLKKIYSSYQIVYSLTKWDLGDEREAILVRLLLLSLLSLLLLLIFRIRLIAVDFMYFCIYTTVHAVKIKLYITLFIDFLKRSFLTFSAFCAVCNIAWTVQ